MNNFQIDRGKLRATYNFEPSWDVVSGPRRLPHEQQWLTKSISTPIGLAATLWWWS